jgi:hypothetical protein
MLAGRLHVAASWQPGGVAHAGRPAARGSGMAAGRRGACWQAGCTWQRHGSRAAWRPTCRGLWQPRPASEQSLQRAGGCALHHQLDQHGQKAQGICHGQAAAPRLGPHTCAGQEWPRGGGRRSRQDGAWTAGCAAAVRVAWPPAHAGGACWSLAAAAREGGGLGRSWGAAGAQLGGRTGGARLGRGQGVSDLQDQALEVLGQGVVHHCRRGRRSVVAHSAGTGGGEPGGACRRPSACRGAMHAA